MRRSQNMKLSLPRALTLIALLALGTACRRSDQAAAPGELPQRIIALAPSAAEVLHVLGLSNRVVGVGDYVAWPPELASKKKLGGLFNPDFESIVALAPDLAILLSSEASLSERLEAVNIEVLVVPSESLGDVEIAVRSIAERCGVAERGESFLRQWRLDLQPNPIGDAMRVALVVGREPRRLGDMVVAGPGTFFDQLLSRLGVSNSFYDAETLYPQVGLEEILRRRPDAVIEVQPFYLHEHREKDLRLDWAQLNALTEGVPCIEFVAGKHVLVPGPRLPQVFAQLRDALESCAVSQRSPE